MNTGKDTIVDLLRGHGQDTPADQARQELPDRVDTDHAGLLEKFGINPADLIATVTGGQSGGGGIGGMLRTLR